MLCIPVSIKISSPDLLAEVSRYVENVLGWQIVENSAHLVAQLEISDEDNMENGSIVVYTKNEYTRTALDKGAKEVISWPDEAHRLADLVSVTRASKHAGKRIVISPTSRRCGTTTLSLAIAAIQAWSKKAVALAAEKDTYLYTGTSFPQELASCPNLWLVERKAGPPNNVELLILESKPSTYTNLLVGTPDRHLLSFAQKFKDPKVISIGYGELLPSELSGFLGKKRYTHFDWSQRIARAGMRGALPQSFPGRFISETYELGLI